MPLPMNVKTSYNIRIISIAKAGTDFVTSDSLDRLIPVLYTDKLNPLLT